MWVRWIKEDDEWRVRLPPGAHGEPGDLAVVSRRNGIPVVVVLGPEVARVAATNEAVHQIAGTMGLDVAVHLLSRLVQKSGLDLSKVVTPQRAPRRRAATKRPKLRLVVGGGAEPEGLLDDGHDLDGIPHEERVRAERD